MQKQREEKYNTRGRGREQSDSSMEQPRKRVKAQTTDSKCTLQKHDNTEQQGARIWRSRAEMEYDMDQEVGGQVPGGRYVLDRGQYDTV